MDTDGAHDGARALVLAKLFFISVITEVLGVECRKLSTKYLIQTKL